MIKNDKKNKSIKVIKTKNIQKQGRKIFNNKIIIFGSISLIIIIFLVLFIVSTIRKADYNKEVITINNITYSKSDYMMYLYSTKYNYFGDNYDKEYDMDVIINDEENITLKKYLQNQVLTHLKTATLINDFANMNNIELDKNDLKKLQEEKNSFIENLGEIGEFNKFLKKNNTKEKSYDKMAKTTALYNKILDSLYSEGKLYDLTEKEKENANNSYLTEYYKIEQIVLTIIDVNTGKSLSETAINQKLLLAKSILEESKKEDVVFSDLVKKYSEDTDELNYVQYYHKDELLDEITNELVNMDNNDISGIIQTKYAIHIIKKLELDDSKLNDYYDSLREDKFIESLVEDMKNLKIRYHDNYKKIKIK